MTCPLGLGEGGKRTLGAVARGARERQKRGWELGGWEFQSRFGMEPRAGLDSVFVRLMDVLEEGPKDTDVRRKSRLAVWEPGRTRVARGGEFALCMREWRCKGGDIASILSTLAVKRKVARRSQKLTLLARPHVSPGSPMLEELRSRDRMLNGNVRHEVGCRDPR